MKKKEKKKRKRVKVFFSFLKNIIVVFHNELIKYKQKNMLKLYKNNIVYFNILCLVFYKKSFLQLLIFRDSVSVLLC